MPRGGRNIPGLKEAWSLKGKLFVKLYKGKVVVQSWPKPYGPPRSQAQADTIKAFKQMQRAMKFQQPRELVTAIETTKGTGMYPRDYIFSAMSGNMHLVESYLTGAISAAMDRLQQFTATGAESFCTFAGIPPGYQALLIIINARSLHSGTVDDINAQLNNDAGNTYDFIRENRSGATSSIAGARMLFGEIPAATAPANYPSQSITWMPGYASNNLFKAAYTSSSLITALTTAGLMTQSISSWWRNTAPVTTITIAIGAAFAPQSTITLHGLY